MEQVRKSECKEVFDVVFVDHGPTMRTRLDDVPFLVKATRKGGVLLFDDCRTTTRYRKKLEVQLSKLGLKLSVPEASGPERRRIGVVKKP
jgi:predicted O-methyltransferase YrrM